MEIKSDTVEIAAMKCPTSEYIEAKLNELEIKPLRWSIVYVDDKIFRVSVANLI